jgi:hypothetical protein
VVGLQPRASRQTLCIGVSSITGGKFIPPLLGRQCLVSVNLGVPREGKLAVGQEMLCNIVVGKEEFMFHLCRVIIEFR